MMLTRNLITSILLLLVFNSCTSINGSEKYSDIKNFPEFTATSDDIQLKQLTQDDENILRVYVSRNKKELIAIAGIKNANPAQKTRSYRFLVYDENLKLVKKIEAPELNGLFGADDIGDLYVDKGFFQHTSYYYKPIQQIWVTKNPDELKLSQTDLDRSVVPPMIMKLEELNDMIGRQDTTLTFFRKDYMGSFYYIKKAGSVYQVMFKNCTYCEAKYNRKWSISEYSAEDSGMEKRLRPSNLDKLGMMDSKAPYTYELALNNENIKFKVPFSEKPGLDMKVANFAGRSILTYQKDPATNSKLYYFQQGHQNTP